MLRKSIVFAILVTVSIAQEISSAQTVSYLNDLTDRSKTLTSETKSVALILDPNPVITVLNSYGDFLTAAHQDYEAMTTTTDSRSNLKRHTGLSNSRSMPMQRQSSLYTTAEQAQISDAFTDLVKSHTSFLIALRGKFSAFNEVVRANNVFHDLQQDKIVLDQIAAVLMKQAPTNANGIQTQTSNIDNALKQTELFYTVRT